MSGRPDGAPNLTPSLNAEVGYEADPERGIEVIKPHPGGSLALAGMVGGDFILSIEGRKLPGLREFVAEVPHCTLPSVLPSHALSQISAADEARAWRHDFCSDMGLKARKFPKLES